MNAPRLPSAFANSHKVYLDQVHELASRALANGGRRVGPAKVEWDCSGNCQAPIEREVFARPSAAHGEKYITVRPPTLTRPNGTEIPFSVVVTVRCRKCDPCRELRRRLWSARARAETDAATRTWFGTLTLSPESHALMLARARKREALQGIDFDALPYGEQFACRHRQVSPEITKFLKRVRKATPGAPLRYLVVAESHKSGLPHYHMLVHETDMLGCVRHRLLSSQWKLGFTQWKLITEPQQAVYLCKYLSKSSAARVRASLRYGNDVLGHSFFNPLRGLEQREKNETPQKISPLSESKILLDGLQ